MKQKWGREGYAGEWPSSKPVWTIGAFFLALLAAGAIYAYRYERVWTPLEKHYLAIYLGTEGAGTIRKDGWYTLLMAETRKGTQLALDEEVRTNGGAARPRRGKIRDAARYGYWIRDSQKANRRLVRVGRISGEDAARQFGEQLHSREGFTSFVTRLDEGPWLAERTRTQVSGSICETIVSLPFGDGTSTSGSCQPSPNFFTGKERDSESGNDYAMARYNVNLLGRFNSSDPLSGSIGDPQSLNRYAYVANNPLSFVDPLGLLLKGPGNTCIGDTNGIVCGPGGIDGGGDNPGMGGGGGVRSFCDASGNCSGIATCPGGLDQNGNCPGG
jgi:RHS repeat-associated protein